ncbi:MAG: glycosyltransferase family 4 protein [Candidatus Cloacimonadota bacterium]|nr:glycosyltransferase family 4 protein [Candidatus Cloacimonadota bacterium]
MKKVLIISYFFPPLGGPGVQRTQKFVKYLPEFGWQPVVLTVKKIEYVAYDESLLSEISNVPIYRTGSCDPMRLLRIWEKLRGKTKKRVYNKVTEKTKKLWREIFPIDSKIGWLPFAIRKGTKLAKKHDFKAVYATLLPYTSALVGYKIAKKLQLPLILDYRDLWLGKPEINFFSAWHRKFSRKWETKVLQFASKVIINTHRACQRIKQLYPQIDPQKFEVLYNGYDSEDFKNQVKKEAGKIVFTYTGGFYGERTPKYFLQALEEMQIPPNVVFRFVGNYFSDIKQLFANCNKKEQLQLFPQVNHMQSVQYLQKSDFLMLFIAKRDSEIVIPAKVFEYLAARRPILAMIPPQGEAAEIISKYKAGLICQIDSISEIKNNINELIHGKTDFKLDKEDYRIYSRRYLTEKLACMLEDN